MKHASVEEFLTLAHNPKGLRPGLDTYLDGIQAKAPTDDRTMLRVCFWILSNIGRTMPLDRVSGLDAKRYNSETRMVAPPWRECIGAILGVVYDEHPHPNPEEDLNEEDVPDEPTEEGE